VFGLASTKTRAPAVDYGDENERKEKRDTRLCNYKETRKKRGKTYLEKKNKEKAYRSHFWNHHHPKGECGGGGVFLPPVAPVSWPPDSTKFLSKVTPTNSANKGCCSDTAPPLPLMHCWAVLPSSLFAPIISTDDEKGVKGVLVDLRILLPLLEKDEDEEKEEGVTGEALQTRHALLRNTTEPPPAPPLPLPPMPPLPRSPALALPMLTFTP
jgi:hypothetical protein